MDESKISQDVFLIDQINCGGRRDAFPALDLWLDNSDNDLLAVAISEPPWFLRRNDYSSGSFTWVRPISYDFDSLCGVFVNTRSSFRQISLTDSNRVCAIEVETNAGPCILISFYLQPDTLEGLDALEEAITKAKRRCRNVYAVGDCNGHSPLWGPEPRNSSGDKIEALILTNDMCIMNQPDCPPTFIDNHGSHHWLDISLATRTLSDYVVSWTVLEGEFPSSDHDLIRTAFALVPSPERKFSYKWAEVDWEQYNEELEAMLIELDDPSQLLSAPGIDSAIDGFTKRLKGLTTRLVPTSEWKGRKKAWFTEDVRRAWRTMRTAKNRLTRRPEERPAFLETRRAFQQTVKEAKRAAFEKFCSEFKPQCMWKKFSLLSKKALPQVPDLLVNERYTTSPQGKAEVLADRFFPPPSAIDSPALRNAKLKRISLAQNDIAESSVYWTSEEEVMKAIGKTRSLSAPGPDGVFNIVLKKCAPVVSPYLTKLFNSCLRLGHFPVPWRSGLVIPIPKGKDNLSLVKNWRPITLLSNIGKLFEKLLCSRLSFFCESKGLLSNCQFGFRPKRGCEPALWAFTEEIYSAFNSRKQVAALSLDLTSAFDSVNHDLLVARLLDISCPAYLAKTIDSFLDSRSATLSLAEGHFSFFPQAGVPQGSCLSPTLFLVFINSLAESISDGSSVSLFADDCLIYRKIDRNNEGLRALQSDVNRAIGWAEDWQMHFNPTKSHFVRFSRLRKAAKARIDLGSSTLDEENEFKYLGILFDRKMSFSKHLSSVQTKAIRRLTQIRRLAAPLWGCDPTIVRCLVKACVLPTVLYGSEIWSPVLKKKCIINALQRVYRLGALAITGSFKTTATAAVIPLACLDYPEVDVSRRLLRIRARLDALQLTKRASPRSGRYASPSSCLHDLEAKVLEQDMEEWERTLLETNHIDSVTRHIWRKASSAVWLKIEDSIWTTTTTASQLKKTRLSPSIWKRLKPFLGVSRRDMSRLTRFLTGHMDCGSYHLKFGHNLEATTCRLCKCAEETRDHFLQCPALSEDLLNCFGRPNFNWISFRWTKPYLKKLLVFVASLSNSLARQTS